MIHFTSDTHWHHANVIEYSNRPYSSVEEMNEALIANWNAVVNDGDVVWHLGDFAFCKAQEIWKITSRLKGQINLVLGNHDKKIVERQRELLHHGVFHTIQHYAEIDEGTQRIVLFHYGARVWNKSHYGSILLYGHSHGNLPPWGKSVDVGVDCKEISDEYRPYSMDEIISYMGKKDIKCVDHHGDRK